MYNLFVIIFSQFM